MKQRPYLLAAVIAAALAAPTAFAAIQSQSTTEGTDIVEQADESAKTDEEKASMTEKGAVKTAEDTEKANSASDQADVAAEPEDDQEEEEEEGSKVP